MFSLQSYWNGRYIFFPGRTTDAIAKCVDDDIINTLCCQCEIFKIITFITRPLVPPHCHRWWTVSSLVSLVSATMADAFHNEIQGAPRNRGTLSLISVNPLYRMPPIRADKRAGVCKDWRPGGRGQLLHEEIRLWTVLILYWS